MGGLGSLGSNVNTQILAMANFSKHSFRSNQLVVQLEQTNRNKMLVDIECTNGSAQIGKGL